MKKTTFITTFVMAFLMLLSVNANAQNFPALDVSPMDAASYPSSYKESNKIIKITYSRPQLNDRTVDKLVPKGKVWRTGANEAPEITFYKDVTFGEKYTIKAGTYTFFIENVGDHWIGIITKELNVWGSYTYEGDGDVGRVKAPISETNEHIEAFSIVFEKTANGADMHLGWGNTKVSFPFKF